MERLLSIKKVTEYIPKSRSTILRWVKNGYFPSPRPIGMSGKVWAESDVKGFINRVLGKDKLKDGETNDEG